MSKTVSVNIRGNIHLSKTANGVQVGVPPNNEVFVFEKNSEDDTTYLDRAEAKLKDAYDSITADIASAKKQTDEMIAELRTGETTEEVTE